MYMLSAYISDFNIYLHILSLFYYILSTFRRLNFMPFHVIKTDIFIIIVFGSVAWFGNGVNRIVVVLHTFMYVSCVYPVCTLYVSRACLVCIYFCVFIYINVRIFGITVIGQKLFSPADRSTKKHVYLPCRGAIPFLFYLVPLRLVSIFLNVGHVEISCGFLPTRFLSILL